jgi:hypothetical protein
VDAEVRLPRTPAEARTNVRYFDELGYRVVVAGPRAEAAAAAIGVPGHEQSRPLRRAQRRLSLSARQRRPTPVGWPACSRSAS